MGNGDQSNNPPSNNRRRSLGRGLGALIVDTQHAPAPELTDESAQHTNRSEAPEDEGRAGTGGVTNIALEMIEPNPQQPRTTFDPEALEELAISIRAHGIIQPLIVTSHPDQAGRYWLIAGERRLRAAGLAELEQVPVIVREASSLQLVEWALVENLQRADLNPLEEAAAYQTLLQEHGLTQAEIGDRVGKSRSAIANTIRLLQLPRPVQDALGTGAISAGHARALLGLADAEACLEALSLVTANDLTVRQTEELVKRIAARAEALEADTAGETQQEEQASDSYADDDDYIAELESRFRDALGTRVSLSRGRDGGGKLTVHYYNQEDLASLYHLIVGMDDEL